MSEEKYVDEAWKENAFEETDKLAQKAESQTEAAQTAGEDQAPVTPESASKAGTEQVQSEEFEINFLNYITSLGFQAMIFMGEIPNPASNKVEKNLTQAKFLIDTLAMLKEKTTGNLDDQENQLLENSVYELQMKYVQIAQSDKETPTQQG